MAACCYSPLRNFLRRHSGLILLQLPVTILILNQFIPLVNCVRLPVANIRPGEAQEIRKIVDTYLNSGRINDLLSYLSAIEQEYHTLLIDDKLPSLYNYLGVALSNAQRPEDAQVAFMEGIKYFPNDTRTMLNLGEIRTQTFKVSTHIQS
jgi:tetratricopeptide (TPR) repeat protein